jgi:hypothetical protein
MIDPQCHQSDDLQFSTRRPNVVRETNDFYQEELNFNDTNEQRPSKTIVVAQLVKKFLRHL